MTYRQPGAAVADLGQLEFNEVGECSMSFWQASNGADVTDGVEKEYDGGGGFALVPDKTNCLAMLYGAEWREDKDRNRYINIRWDIIKDDAYKGIVIFQKLWVKDDDPNAKDPAKKRDKALRMLAAIDANAGGKLARKGREPDDDDLAVCLTNKQMMIKCMVWDIDGKEGNWIAAVGPKGGNMSITVPVSESKRAARKINPVDDLDDDLDDDVPF